MSDRSHEPPTPKPANKNCHPDHAEQSEAGEGPAGISSIASRFYLPAYRTTLAGCIAWGLCLRKLIASTGASANGSFIAPIAYRGSSE